MASKLEAVIFDLYETGIAHYRPNRSPAPSIAEQLGLDVGAFSQAWRDTYDRRNSGAMPDCRTAPLEAGRNQRVGECDRLIYRRDLLPVCGASRVLMNIIHSL